MLQTLTRRAIFALAGAQAALFASGAHAAVATPRQTPGPFYPPPNQRPADTDWDLVKVAGRVREAGGEVLHLVGQVLDIGGEPVTDALVEIWQCDVNGRYHHSGDTGGGRPKDEDFQGFGAVRTDETGHYRFRTIKPVAYPGRTPHIHARVVPRKGAQLITQIYLLDEPLNDRDGIFRRLSPESQAAVTIDPIVRSDGDMEAGFNFVL